MASTQDNPLSPSGPRLTLEQLLQLKRSEQPEAEFWARFERDLKQRQLQALVKPRRSERILGWLSAGRQPAFAAVGAAVVCLLAAWMAFAPFRTAPLGGEMAAAGEISAGMMGNETILRAFAEPIPGAEPLPGEAAASPVAESRFIIETLAGQREKADVNRHFRTESRPQTLFAAVDAAKDYGVRSYTREGASLAGSGARTLQF